MCVKDEIGEGEPEEIQKPGSCASSEGEASSFADSPMERMCESTISIDHVKQVTNFVPMIRSGEWFDIGVRECIDDLAKRFRCHHSHDAEAVSFYGVFDGHGGKDAAHFFAKTCRIQVTLPSGTTALVAMISERSLLVANAGDCRAVLLRLGVAIEMPKDHRPCCARERRRIESLGGFIDDGYLNGQLGVTRALGDWHLEGIKQEDHS